MKINVKYSNGKLFSNNKDIILNNVAEIHEIVEEDPNALTTKLFFGIVKDGDGEMRIFIIVPVRSLVNSDVIYLYVWDKYTKHWRRLDKFTETRTIFDSFDECADFYMKTKYGVSDGAESGKSIADELLDEVNKKSREDIERKNFDELCEHVKKIEEYRKLTAEIAKAKAELKNAETQFKFADEDYNKAVEEYRLITREFERRREAWESAKKLKEQCEKKHKELDNRRAELDIEDEANDFDANAFWNGFLRQCFGE